MAGVAILLTAFANADNDVRDYEIDRIAHPERPLPVRSAVASRRRGSSWASPPAAALILASLLGGAQTLAAVGVIAAMTLYNRGVKAHGVPGNVVVAVVASLPFLFGAWSAGRQAPGIPLFLVGVPLHFAREIAKDLDDVDGDARYRRTLPLARRARRGATRGSKFRRAVRGGPGTVRGAATGVRDRRAPCCCALSRRRSTGAERTAWYCRGC